MNRKEFLERLEKLLWNISDSEREEALQYYNDYFDDAGEENEARVIEELVSPEQVAQKIKAGLSDSASEYSERGYEDTRFQNSQEVISREQVNIDQEHKEQADRRNQSASYGTNFWKILAIVLLCIVVAPVIIPIFAAIFAVLVAIVIGLIGAAIGIVAAGFTLLVVGIVVIGVGIAQIFAVPSVGIAMAGVGCLIFAIGVLFSIFTIWCCVKIIPGLIRGIVGLISYPFRKVGAKK
ncbi:MAG: DUF1700 domain-containing protein [Lachnospiraceae bacterium]|jgi:uncharacterized membrane protein|nr:DUF1700 domain-containing protein [Lachnospiraceae bacterium]